MLLATGALLAALGVLLGAFGAHALEGRLEPALIETFNTGARYHQIQALGVILLALVAQQRPTAPFSAAGWVLVLGIVVFSGSLYLLAVTGTRWLGAVTPLGGLLMIAGWVLAAWSAFRSA